MLTAVASDDGDRAPALNGHINGNYRGRGFAAWQVMYDELADGEWHSQRDLIRAAQIEIGNYSTTNCVGLLSLAATGAHVKREYRASSGFDRKPEPWYRRNREDAS